MRRINVLAIQRISKEARDKITANDLEIDLVDAGGWFDDEVREAWGEYTASRTLPLGAAGSGTREERDRLLAKAEVIVGGWPFPRDIRARAPRLKWFHQLQAGASNILGTDLWNSDVVVTTSRGVANSLPIAEFALAGILYFAKGLSRAVVDHDGGAFNRDAYRPVLLMGKTLCVVGAGGIGAQLGRLGAALGMRVLGTRRQPGQRTLLPEGFSEIGGPEDIDQLLRESDFVAICCQLTPETKNLFNADRFAAMRTDSVLVNVARGEIVDEKALIAALDSGRLRGAALDVYIGEFQQPPPPELWSHRQVLVTPHVSNGGDQSQHGGIDVFCENLQAYRAGRVLENVIDWQRGY